MIKDHIYQDSEGNTYSTERKSGGLTHTKTDERNVVYSEDFKRLIIVGDNRFGPTYTIRSSTKVICSMAFFNKDFLYHITFPEGLLAIGQSAFSRSDGLEEIVIPSSVQSIESKAFFNMTRLKRIIFLGLVKEIDISAFSECHSIETISVPKGSFEKYSELIPEHSDKIKEEDTSLLSDESDKVTNPAITAEMAELVIPDNTMEIEESQFAGLQHLKKVTIPDSVMIINDKAFSGCTSLEEIYIPDSVEYLGQSAFEGCTSLKKANIPVNTLNLGDYIFKGCSSLSKVELCDSLISIGDSAFQGCSSLRNIDFPKSLETIGRDAFYGCSSLERVSLPKNVKQLHERAFAFCKSLLNITFSRNITVIPTQLLFGCVSLNHLFLPNTIRRIEEEAFAACLSLTEITIPKVITCPPSAFFDCPNVIVSQGSNNDNEFLTPIEKLQSMVGLDFVKQTIQTLVNLIKIQNKRASLGLKESAYNYHCLFSGNPGTGKTSVAHLMAEIYKELGVIKKGHLVETNQSDFIGDNLGQTISKTNAIVDSALDGVLFIDESPSILNERNGLGIEALKTLLKRMDDDKDRLIVILAGTHQYMIQMIEAIPNLQTRLKNVFEFPNYSSEELFDIFNIHLSSNNFSMSEKAAIRMRKILDDAFTNKQCSGNGHFVSTLYDRVISNQASRLAQSSNLTIEELTLITENDLKDII